MKKLCIVCLALCLLLTGCGRPGPSESVVAPPAESTVEPSSQPEENGAEQPDSQPEENGAEQPSSQPEDEAPSGTADLPPVSYVAEEVHDFIRLSFDVAGPYTAQEKEALTGDEPWQGVTDWGSAEKRIAYDGSLHRLSYGQPFLEKECSLNGSVLSVCPAPDNRLYILTTDGRVWSTTRSGADPQQLGTLAAVAGQPLQQQWVSTCTDGQVYWFCYGDQVARLYLPTGRVDAGTLPRPCRIWQPLTRSKLYCQYLLADEGYVPIYRMKYYEQPTVYEWPAYESQNNFTARLLHTLQAGYDLESNAEYQLFTVQHPLLQQQPAGSAPSYDEYFSQERPVRLNEETPLADGSLRFVLRQDCEDIAKTTIPENQWKWISSENLKPIAEQSLYLYRYADNTSTVQLWSTNGTLAQVDCELNGQILDSYYHEGSLYLWTENNRLYRVNTDGAVQQLLFDTALVTAGAGLQNVTGQVQFAGPLAWVQVQDQLYRVYLPEGQVDTMSFALPAGAESWQPVSNRTVEYTDSDGAVHRLHHSA